MEFKRWILSERTLYHGTIIDNEESIREFGLIGQLGDFVKSAYDDEGIQWNADDELVFATDKQNLKTALTAMVHHIGKKLNKNFHDVTDNDIINHGLLIIIHDGEYQAKHRPEDDENYYGQHPQAVEPGDYYSDEMTADQFVKGKALLRVLKRYKAWPRNWGPDNPTRNKQRRGMLIQKAIAAHPERSKEEIIKTVQSLTDSEVQEYLRRYK